MRPLNFIDCIKNETLNAYEEKKEEIDKILNYLRSELEDLFSLVKVLKNKELLKVDTFYEKMNKIIALYSLLVSRTQEDEEVIVSFSFENDGKVWYIFGVVSKEIKDKILKLLDKE